MFFGVFFFTDWDPMGFITIIHYNLGEYFLRYCKHLMQIRVYNENETWKVGTEILANLCLVVGFNVSCARCMIITCRNCQ